MAYTFLGICLIGTLIFVGLLIYADIKTTNLKDDYIRSLDEHDKSVIATYKATKYKLGEKKKHDNI